MLDLMQNMAHGKTLTFSVALQHHPSSIMQPGSSNGSAHLLPSWCGKCVVVLHTEILREVIVSSVSSSKFVVPNSPSSCPWCQRVFRYVVWGKMVSSKSPPVCSYDGPVFSRFLDKLMSEATPTRKMTRMREPRTIGRAFMMTSFGTPDSVDQSGCCRMQTDCFEVLGEVEDLYSKRG